MPFSRSLATRYEGCELKLNTDSFFSVRYYTSIQTKNDIDCAQCAGAERAVTWSYIWLHYSIYLPSQLYVGWLTTC